MYVHFEVHLLIRFDFRWTDLIAIVDALSKQVLLS